MSGLLATNGTIPSASYWYTVSPPIHTSTTTSPNRVAVSPTLSAGAASWNSFVIAFIVVSRWVPTFATMPVGTPHSFKNESNKPARMLISVAPAGLEQMFFEVGVPLAEGATTALPPTKEEIEKLLAVAPSYGIEIKLPGH